MIGLFNGPCTDELVAVVPGELPGDNTNPAGWVSAKNRQWRLTTPGLCANIPQNGHRCGLIVDATNASADAFVFLGTAENTSDTTCTFRVPAGSLWEMPWPFWKGPMMVGVAGTTPAPNEAIVTELSYR